MSGKLTMTQWNSKHFLTILATRQMRDTQIGIIEKGRGIFKAQKCQERDKVANSKIPEFNQP